MAVLVRKSKMVKKCLCHNLIFFTGVLCRVHFTYATAESYLVKGYRAGPSAKDHPKNANRYERKTK